MNTETAIGAEPTPNMGAPGAPYAEAPYVGMPPTAMPPSNALIQARGLMQRYIVGKQEVRALDGLDLDIERGEFVALVGPSGSGKSTLLNLAGGLVRPSFGSIRVDGLELGTANDKQLVQYRREKVGFIFQSFNLIVTRTAVENVEVPMMLNEIKAKDRRKRAQELLESVGLGVRANHRPNELSGGEMQRVAVARALSNNPVVLLADEPTGNLDSRTGSGILDLLRYAVKSQGVTMLLVTHDMHVASYADRVVHMRDVAFGALTINAAGSNNPPRKFRLICKECHSNRKRHPSHPRRPPRTRRSHPPHLILPHPYETQR